MAQYIKPQQLQTEDGAERRVGFELEFAGMEMPQVANAIIDTLEGELQPKTHAECVVSTPQLGDFKVELDWQYAKETAEQRAQDQSGDDESLPEDPAMELLTRVASQVVPVEVVCPPIEIGKLHHLDALVDRLRDEGALGTFESVFYAFGVHINPELPDLTAPTIHRYLCAYSVCQNWLVKSHEVDVVRRIAPYIDLYPNGYIKSLFELHEPSAETLIDHYLEWNPTRNRSLDMTPLFMHMDAERLEAHLQDPRINGRPTFHYRLPNCVIEKEGWYLSESWRRWCVIEYLAHDETLLGELMNAWLEFDSNLISFEEESWHTKLDQISASLASE